MISQVIILALVFSGAWAQGSYVVPFNGTVTFQSPNYPNGYANNYRGVYNIVGPIGYGILFNSDAFDLETGSTDTLTFSEVINGTTVRLGVFSGRVGPRNLRSITHSVTATFVTGNSNTWTGFKIVARSFVTLIEDGNVTVPFGGTVLFQSKGFPNSYGANLRVAYTFAESAGNRIQFDAMNFDLANMGDTLTFTEVTGNGILTIGTFTGLNGPRKLLSTTSSVTAIFVTDGSFTKSGFKIAAQSCAFLSCPVEQGSVVVPYTGNVTFQSRAYPLPYANNLNVVYNIEGPGGFRIQFDTNRFELGNLGDTLTFREIVDGNTVMLGTFTGSAANTGPSKLLSSTSSVTATFTTDSGIAKPGFNIMARSCASLNCPVEHGRVEVPPARNVTFQSRGYPSPYENNLRVVYNIVGPTGYGIQFDTEGFDTENNRDILTLSEIVNGASVVLGTFSGVNGPRGLLSTTGSVTATFVTDNSWTKPGYKITARSRAPVVSPVEHGNVAVHSVGHAVFQSPGYPNTYGLSLNVVYKILGPAGSGIQFDAEAFETEAGYDYLTFSELIGNQNVVLGSFSGNAGPRRLRSSTNSVTATFRSDSGLSLKGFRIVAHVPRSRNLRTVEAAPLILTV